MGRIKKITSRKINSRINLKSKKRRKARVNRIKKKKSNKYTKKKINVKRRGIKYYSGGVDTSGVDTSVEVPNYISYRDTAERKCAVGSRCGQSFFQTNMRLFSPHYGEKIEGIKYNIKQRKIKDSGNSKLFHLICEIEQRTGYTHVSHSSGRNRLALLETFEIQYELYTPLIEGKIQKGGYIYLRSINISKLKKRPLELRGRSTEFNIEDVAMKIFCSEVAWLLHRNKIQIYWDILVDPEQMSNNSEEYYRRFDFTKRNNDYEIFIPESDIPESDINDNIMIVNVLQFVMKCQGRSIDMGPY